MILMLIFFLILFLIILVFPLRDNQLIKYDLLEVVPDIPKISNFELMALILLNVKANWSPLFEAINSFNSSTIK